MNIIEIIEITPIVANNIGWVMPTKGRLKTPAIIAIHPITNVVKAVNALSLIPDSFEYLYRFKGFVIIMKPTPIIISQRKLE